MDVTRNERFDRNTCRFRFIGTRQMADKSGLFASVYACVAVAPEGLVGRSRVAEWMGELSKEAPVVVYCAYGFHVGCRTAIALREAGFDARYMKVGHSGWKAIGAPVHLHSAP